MIELLGTLIRVFIIIFILLLIIGLPYGIISIIRYSKDLKKRILSIEEKLDEILKKGQ